MIPVYEIVKSLHILAVVAWMAGMLYLPRLFVYHHKAKAGGELAATLIVMERRLLKGIMTPSMLATWGFGLALLGVAPEWGNDLWLWLKLVLVLAMTALHGIYAGARRKFAAGDRPKSERYWRIMNEAPFVVLIVIVFLVILKPGMR